MKHERMPLSMAEFNRLAERLEAIEQEDKEAFYASLQAQQKDNRHYHNKHIDIFSQDDLEAFKNVLYKLHTGEY